jgi:predicted outer membrane repeat protein
VKKIASVCAVCACALCAALGTAQARTWAVEPDGSGDAPTIQAAIDSAGPGDEVLLSPGTFTGPGNRDISFKGKGVVVRSSDGPDATTLDCGGLGRAFLFVSHEGQSSVLQGVRIVNGSHALFGGAVYCANSSPYVVGNVFESNSAGFRGGAVYCDTCSARIEGNTFEGNQCAYGGAIACSGSSALEISSSDFRRNGASISGGAIACRGSSPAVFDNRFTENTAANEGGAVFCDEESGPSVTANTFALNTAGDAGGAVSLLQSTAVIEQNYFRRNEAGLGGGIYCNNFSSGPIRHNTFDENGAGSGSGAAVYCTNYSAPAITRNIVANSQSGNAVETKNFSAPTIGCCCFFNNAGGDALPQGAIDGGFNFAVDPEFCGIDGSGNCFLQSDSPCAPGNGPGGGECGLVGAFPVGCETTSTEEKTWGAIKARYRGR